MKKPKAIADWNGLRRTLMLGFSCSVIVLDVFVVNFLDMESERGMVLRLKG